MKKQLFHLAITFAFLFMVSTEIKSTNPSFDDPPEYSPILLQGHLDYGSGSNDVEAYYYQNAIYISFTHSFGNVSISLYNTSHFLVYNDIFNTDVETLIVIPIIDNSYGTYTLVMESANGYAEGEFEI